MSRDAITSRHFISAGKSFDQISCSDWNSVDKPYSVVRKRSVLRMRNSLAWTVYQKHNNIVRAIRIGEKAVHLVENMAFPATGKVHG